MDRKNLDMRICYWEMWERGFGCGRLEFLGFCLESFSGLHGVSVCILLCYLSGKYQIGGYSTLFPWRFMSWNYLELYEKGGMCVYSYACSMYECTFMTINFPSFSCLSGYWSVLVAFCKISFLIQLYVITFYVWGFSCKYFNVVLEDVDVEIKL